LVSKGGEDSVLSSLFVHIPYTITLYDA